MRLTLAVLTLPLLCAAEALACGGTPICTVTDPTGTPLNVRAGPNGRILSTLRNGQQVEFIEHRDSNGQTWALIASFDPGSEVLEMDGAWVFRAYVTCDGPVAGLGADPATADWDKAVPCTVADPTGTPLNLRADPGGALWGTVKNGTVLRAVAIRQHKGKDWVYVSRWSEDNAIGWVYDPYLSCEEDA